MKSAEFDSMKKIPNVVLVVLDTLRARNMSLYGYPKGTTPFLDELASESVVFRNAWPPVHGPFRPCLDFHRALPLPSRSQRETEPAEKRHADPGPLPERKRVRDRELQRQSLGGRPVRHHGRLREKASVLALDRFLGSGSGRVEEDSERHGVPAALLAAGQGGVPDQPGRAARIERSRRSRFFISSITTKPTRPISRRECS